MRYVALGDSISIDDYTGVAQGGAASQFAARIGASGQAFQNLTRDGQITEGVLADLGRVTGRPDVVTLTIGGNDVLLARPAAVIRTNLGLIARQLAAHQCPVIINTIYDPTDGDDTLASRLGLSPDARACHTAVNEGIRTIAREHGFLLSDLQALFQGHGIQAPESWIVEQIEPSYAGATAIAEHWLRLFLTVPRERGGRETRR